MKELAQRMGCDASFVTSIADALERHGFARRAPSERDRRVKHLLLTEEGIAAKERMMRELAARMPWCYALDEAERQCFLGLLKKMVDAARAQAWDGTQENGPALGQAPPSVLNNRFLNFRNPTKKGNFCVTNLAPDGERACHVGRRRARCAGGAAAGGEGSRWP